MEVEIKFLKINKDQIIQKILSLGAKKIFSKNMITTVFSNNDFSTKDSTKKYLRIRKIEDKHYLTYKSPRLSQDVDKREETEFLINEPEELKKLFENMGFESFTYTKFRTHFALGKVKFEIDEYEHIPAYLEIESDNKQDLIEYAEKLGLDFNDGKVGTIEVMSR